MQSKKKIILYLKNLFNHHLYNPDVTTMNMCVPSLFTLFSNY